MLVEDLVQGRFLWEMLGNKGEESVSNVGLHAFTIWRVEPRNIPLALSLFGLLVGWDELHFTGESTSSQGFFVGWRCF